MLVVEVSLSEPHALPGGQIEAINLAEPKVMRILVAAIHQASVVAGERTWLIVDSAARLKALGILQMRLRRFYKICHHQRILSPRQAF